MKHPVAVPSAGESINEVFIGTWLKKTGDLVKKDEVLVDLETEKANFDLQAEVGGRLEVLFPEKETKVKPGDVIAYIDDSAAKQESPSASVASKISPPPPPSAREESSSPILSPSARKMAAEKNIPLDKIQGTGKGGRVTKEDVAALDSRSSHPNLKLVQSDVSPGASVAPAPAPSEKVEYVLDTARGERKERATRIRRTIAQNLVAAQHHAAILTTFNEVDMSQVMAFRKKHKEAFKTKYGAPLGMVSFFAFAAVRALKEMPVVNATFTGEDIIYRDFVDLSIAVGTESGLVVPVLRDVQSLNFGSFEKKLSELSDKAQKKKLSIPEMTGGTFTISNGGVYGSLLSTPILNRPQSAILGLHKIQERPVVVEGAIVARPMMYLALSYDHRLIDGREAVTFLVKIKEGIENLALILNEKDF
ncbi:MAG: 2-oxoglutarate dehydrogenase complex dihydrolipoyllysine-residue succinyltransferase [bacterium]